MPDYLMNDIVLVRYPFSDLQIFKVRPATFARAKLPNLCEVFNSSGTETQIDPRLLG